MTGQENENKVTVVQSGPKRYDLEDRTLQFAQKCMDLCQGLEKSRINFPLVDQLIRSSSSIGANYREAGQALSKKEFYYRISICRKEAKESRYWLELLCHGNGGSVQNIEPLVSEALQLTKIFSAIFLRHR